MTASKRIFPSASKALIAAHSRQLDEAQRIARIGSWEVAVRTGKAVWSHELYRIVGEPVGSKQTLESFLERVLPEDRTEVRAVFGRALSDGGRLAFEARVVARSGEIRWIRSLGEVMLDEARRPARMVGTVQEITLEKEAAVRLTAAESRFRTVFEHSPIGMLLLRRGGGPYLVNPAAARIHGVAPEALVGVRPDGAFAAEDVLELDRLTEQLWSGERRVVEFEGRTARPDGELVWVKTTSLIVSDDDEPSLFVQLEDITARRAADAALTARADRDALTGLDNRGCFADQLKAALGRRAGDGQVAVLLLDLDGFKAINDGLGHHAGDRVLREVACRISRAVRGSDRVGRLGGDEFAVLLHGVRVVDDAIAVATNIARDLDEALDAGGMDVRISASVGIAVAPADGNDAETLMRKADIAMYRAKTLRSGWALFKADEDSFAAERLGLVGELRRMIESEELDVAFQPLMRTASGRIPAVEALARWHHPKRGLVPPDQFIPLAEQAGLISPLTRVVLRKALAACAAWNALGHDVGIGVNMSVRGLEDDDFAAVVAEELDRAGLAPERLTLELTESALAADADALRGSLSRLHQLGIRLFLDDFGTGYSAMSYLKDLPIDGLKIDRSFVRDIVTDARDVPIVRALVELAQSLGLRVVAEGVETREAISLLTAIGCDLVQGYAIARPMTETELTGWLDDRVAAQTAVGARAA